MYIILFQITGTYIRKYNSHVLTVYLYQILTSFLMFPNSLFNDITIVLGYNIKNLG